MRKVNLAIRDGILKADIKQWELAEAYGISESNFSRLLRRELPIDQQKKIISIINNLKNKRK